MLTIKVVENSAVRTMAKGVELGTTASRKTQEERETRDGCGVL